MRYFSCIVVLAILLPVILTCEYEAGSQTTICTGVHFTMGYQLPLDRYKTNMILSLENVTGTLFHDSLGNLTHHHVKQLIISGSYLEQIHSGAMCSHAHLYSIEFTRNIILPPVENVMFDKCRNLTKLVFNGNYQFELTEEPFVLLHDLQHLYIQFQHVPYIKQGYFVGLYSLEVLALEYCSITVIEPGAFDNLTSLKNLLLTRNSIATIQDNTFLFMANLKILYLYGNLLRTVSGNEFNGLKTLERLSLSDNPVELIDIYRLLTALPRLRTLGIDLLRFPEDVRYNIETSARYRNVTIVYDTLL